MELAISRALLDEIRAHADETPDQEVCGLLLGSGAAVSRVVRCHNVAPDPRRHFEIDAGTLIAAHRAGRGDGPGLIGHYHSHPTGPAIPSAQDAAMADPGSYWLILSRDDIGCWWSMKGGAVEGMFDAVRIG